MASKKRASPRKRIKETVDTYAAGKLEALKADTAQKVRRALLNGELTEADIVALGVPRDAVDALLDEFRDAGANLVRHGGRWSIDRYMAPDSERAWKFTAKDGRYRFGLIADTHLGSKHYRADVAEGLYDWFAAEKVDAVFHCGNWIDGEARFNKHELVPEAHGMQAQIDYMVEHYPQRRGVTTYYVAGDDHEGWYSQREGVDIGRMLSDTASRAGRTDLVYLGYKEAFITLEHPKTKKHARLLVDHPGGGSSYALSYAAQKRVEAAQGGEKPAIWCFGHWHKHGYFIVRNVHCILVPCTKDLDTFGRKKGLEYTIGGAIIDAYQDEGGAIVQVNPQFRLWFDRGYYNQQFSMSGPVQKRVTR